MKRINFLKADTKRRIGVILVGALILYSLGLVIYSSVLTIKADNLSTTLKITEETLATKTEEFEKELKNKDFLIQDYKEKNEFLLGLLDETNTKSFTAVELQEEAEEDPVETEISEINTDIEVTNSMAEPTSETTESEVIIENPEEPAYEELLWDESYTVQLTESERRDFAALIMLESQGESMECKKAVASVVINRMRVNGLSLREVLYAENQFEPAPYISSTTPSEECYEAVDFVCAYGPTIPVYVTFFRADYHFSWAIPYTVIDHTFFSYSPYVYDAVMNGV